MLEGNKHYVTSLWLYEGVPTKEIYKKRIYRQIVISPLTPRFWEPIDLAQPNKRATPSVHPDNLIFDKFPQDAINIECTGELLEQPRTGRIEFQMAGVENYTWCARFEFNSDYLIPRKLGE